MSAEVLVARRGVRVVRVAVVLGVAHCRSSHQVNHGEQRDPDDVQGVPEQAEAQDAPQDIGPVSLGEHLRHHRQQPQQAGGHVQAVAADQREEGREERAARRAGAARDHAGELVHLEAEERRAEHEGRRHRAIEPEPAVRPGADARDAAGEARQQQAGRLDRDVAQVEQVLPARSARRVARPAPRRSRRRRRT